MQIKKVDYKKYGKQKGEKKKLIARGYCYYLFWSRWSAKGFRIPYSLRIIQRFKC